MQDIIEQLVAFVVWLVANATYLDMRRRGRRGFMRLVAFWFGSPATWIMPFVVREGTQPDIAPAPDADQELLLEVRRQRRLAPRPDGDETPRRSSRA